MSKSKRNFPDPLKIIDQYGVDSLRLYFASSPIMKTAQNVNFSPLAIDEIRKRQFVILWNIFAFYKLYDDGQPDLTWPSAPLPVLDTWLVSRLENLTALVSQAMDNYDLVTAARALSDFVPEFSQFWLRLSRDRLRDKDHHAQVLQIFRTAFYRYLLLLSPIAPFFTELVYQNLVTGRSDSIHLEPWLPANLSRANVQLENQVKELRVIIEKAHSLRKEKGVKARQPLASLTVQSPLSMPNQELCSLLTQELNVKHLDWHLGPHLQVSLDFNLTPALQVEGEAREIIRTLQNERKKMGTDHNEYVSVELPAWPQDYTDYIATRVLAREIRRGDQVRVIRD